MLILAAPAPRLIARRRHIVIADPAVGQDWLTLVPDGVAWRPVAFAGVFITGAAVANRSVQLVVLTGAALRVFQTGANVDHPASTDKSYTAGAGVGYCGRAATTVSGAEKYMMPLPVDLWALSGWVIGTATGQIQGADQWFQPRLTVEERGCDANGNIF